MTAAESALLLARIQFGFTVSFHFIFPSFSSGLASYLMVLEGLWLFTKKQLYLDLFRFWVKIFAVAFAMGVAAMAALAVSGVDFSMVPQRMMYAVNSFPLMSIPFFMLAVGVLIQAGSGGRLSGRANSRVGRGGVGGGAPGDLRE